MLGYAEDSIIHLGLSCLNIALSALRAIHRVFWEIGFSTLQPRIIDRQAECEDISRLENGLAAFLQALREVALSAPHKEDLANQLTHFYGVLILILIRFTIRSALRCSEHGFIACDFQKSLDESFVRGSKCPIYRVHVMILEASRTAIAETQPKVGNTDEKSLWLYTQCHRASKLLAMPDGWNKTLGEHLRYSIDCWLDQ